MKVKGSSGSFLKKNKNNTKKGKFKRRNKRANSRASDFFVTFWDTRKGMPSLPKGKMKVYIIFSLLSI